MAANLLEQQCLNQMMHLQSVTGGQFNTRNITDEPTHTDVLLGRGLATIRHPGNENFRDIVSQHVNAYVTSTKKEKMTISRLIVDKVLNGLNPPGRFLEKNAHTGLWEKVDNKRALEKTAQALRDGAAPLRKQLSEDVLGALFAGGSDSCGKKFPIPSLKHPIISNKFKKWRREQAASSITSSSLDNCPSRQKRQCHNIGISQIGLGAHNTMQKNVGWPKCSSSDFSQISTNHSPVQPGLAQLYNCQPNSIFTTEILPSPQQTQWVRQQTSMQPWQLLTISVSSQGNSAIPKDPLSSLGSGTWDTSIDQKVNSNSMISPATNISACDKNNVNDVAAAFVDNSAAMDEEEFAKEMGPDEHFFGLCNPDPIVDDFFMDEEVVEKSCCKL